MRFVVPILVIAALIAVVVALMRRGRRQGPGTYQRKFNGAQQSQDNSVMFPAVIMGSIDHGHHPSHGADCAPQSDSGASCSDAGAGADGGGSS